MWMKYLSGKKSAALRWCARRAGTAACLSHVYLFMCGDLLYTMELFRLKLQHLRQVSKDYQLLRGFILLSALDSWFRRWNLKFIDSGISRRRAGAEWGEAKKNLLKWLRPSTSVQAWNQVTRQIFVRNARQGNRWNVKISSVTVACVSEKVGKAVCL